MNPTRAAFGPVLLGCCLLASAAHAATLSVGPGKAYTKPCAAVAMAQDNDVIEIDADGDYGGDVCQVDKNGLTLRGVGGRAKIDAQGQNYGGKAIWVISGHDTTVENIEFSGATVVDQNGAGIRQEGNNLTVRGCYFHDNDDGILTGAGASSQIVIEFSEFAHNGFGDGYSHNMYIGNVGSFTLRYSYSHDAKVGHLVKSRAAKNFILYNRISGELGSSSYEIDLPNAGTAVILGNLIEQGPSTQNPTLLTYGEEGVQPGNPGHDLYAVNNTFLNDRANGGTFVNIGASVDVPALLQNNIFSGSGTSTNQATATSTTNFSGADPLLVDPGTFDYHLQPGSPCVDQGSAPSMAAGMSLTPICQYVHPTSAQGRVGVGTIDIGAYELGGGNDTSPSGAYSAIGAGGARAQAGAGNTTGGAGNTTGGAGNTTGGAGGGHPASSNDSASCACHIGQRRNPSSHWLAVFLLALTLHARRRPSSS